MNWRDYWKIWCDYYSRSDTQTTGCGPVLMASLLALFILVGCATKRSSESSVEVHRVQLMTERMDSILHATSTWQKSIFEKQTALVDSFKHSEVRDTSRTYFLGERGDTVREIIKVYVERNTEHTTQESEKEYMEEMLHKSDSILQAAFYKMSLQDSLLREHQKDTVVEKQTPWYERWWNGLRNLLALVAVALIVAKLIRKYLPFWKGQKNTA